MSGKLKTLKSKKFFRIDGNLKWIKIDDPNFIRSEGITVNSNPAVERKRVCLNKPFKIKKHNQNKI